MKKLRVEIFGVMYAKGFEREPNLSFICDSVEFDNPKICPSGFIRFELEENSIAIISKNDIAYFTIIEVEDGEKENDNEM